MKTAQAAIVVVCCALADAGCNRSTPTAAPVKILSTSAAPLPARGSPGAGTAVKDVLPLSDIAQSLNVNFTYRNGFEADQSTILESLGGGVGWLDYDRDGWLDLLAAGGGNISKEQKITGLPAALFAGQAGRSFREVSGMANMRSSDLYAHGLAIADYDDDGFQDFIVTGYGKPQVRRNMGDGTFQEVSGMAGINDSRWGSSAGWADLNGDGQLDVYLAHYVNWSFANHPYCEYEKPTIREICPPRAFDPLPHAVYYSRGDGTFEDASSLAGLRNDGKGLGVLLADVEPDGDVDIYVANDTTDNFLYINDGRGRFAEAGIARGVALDDNGVPNGSMGLDLCDFNQDGRPDLWVANYERESFAMYRNEGRGHFLHLSQRLGISDLGGLFVGFGTACADFDSDGDEDIIVANGHVIKYPDTSPRRQLPLLLQYNGKRFERRFSVPGTYFGEPHEGRGLATADFDADGDLDVAVSHLNEPLALLENTFHGQNRWLSVLLVGTRSNRDAVGARVEMQLGAKTISRQVSGGGSYLSHSARALLFVLPNDSHPRTLVVHWPAGDVQKIDVASLFGNVMLIEPLAAGETQTRLIAREVGQ